MANSLLTSFLSALQASLSVLLQIFYGVVATQWGLISEGPAKAVSTLCVKMFLPALLMTNIGSQLDSGSGPRYASIIVWALIYNFSSILLGASLRRLLGFPRWATPAVTFNNTIAFPLILLQSLGTTGILKPLLWGPNDTTSAALDRAKSYFLVNSTVSDTLTFGIGPKLLGVDELNVMPAPDAYSAGFSSAVEGEGNPHGDSDSEDQDPVRNAHRSLYGGEEAAVAANEETTLLPNKLAKPSTQLAYRSSKIGGIYWKRMPGWIQVPGDWVLALISAPLIAAVIGVIIGLVPALKTAFFEEPEDGGIFQAWLTTSVKNMGELFASLQIVIVGVKLCQSLKNMKHGEQSGPVPWGAGAFVLIVRFVIWPLISISAIWWITSRTGLIAPDPMLWFSMMMQPTGPPALGLIALADIAGDSEDDKMSIAKFLVVAYAISPIMTFVVVGALKASVANLTA